MKRILAAVAAVLGLLGSAGHATASGPADSALQLAAQAAASAQGAGAQSGANQSQPSNSNISVRVQSPGDAGDVTQSNTVASGATATNANATDQSAAQAQGGSACCGSGTQAVGQEASSSQAAGALSHASQQGASNENISVRVQSPGDDGSVSQSNTAASGAAATNANATGQSADQASAGGTGTQAIGQESDNEQAALAASSAEQTGAKNSNIAVRVQSPGDDGDVEQSNTVVSTARAGNLNLTGQDATQSGGSGTQAIGQEAASDQTAAALSSAKQTGATNSHVPVRVQSPGDGGRVSQSNTVASAATAANLNGTEQSARQSQSGDCRCASGGTQAVGQEATSHQGALAISGAEQIGATNEITPVRVDSRGDDGDVSQSNTVASGALAANLNATEQGAEQSQSGDCRCASGGTQAIGQEAENGQAALAVSLAAQELGRDRCGCASGGNSYAPVRVDSSGDGGSVEQSNEVASAAAAANLNGTAQSAGQAQSGGGVQAIGQEAKSEQAAIGLSAALQHGASNSSTPVRVDSRGDDGDVSQLNGAYSAAEAGNGNLTVQDAEQAQAGSCGCGGVGIQAIGQEAENGQLALAGSLALQLGASNESAPVRVDSPGGGGSLEQSNEAGSYADAGNLNLLGQSAGQSQSAGGGTAIQAIGQSASSHQAAIALSAALQLGASNAHSPVLVGSNSDGGDVSQANTVASGSRALNANLTAQEAAQRQATSCGCHGVGIQALGQSADNAQFAFGLSAALQLAARNGRSTAI
jgi:hypothetical protein